MRRGTGNSIGKKPIQESLNGENAIVNTAPSLKEIDDLKRSMKAKEDEILNDYGGTGIQAEKSDTRTLEESWVKKNPPRSRKRRRKSKKV